MKKLNQSICYNKNAIKFYTSFRLPYKIDSPIKTSTITFNTIALSDNKGASYGGPLISEFEIYTPNLLDTELTKTVNPDHKNNNLH